MLDTLKHRHILKQKKRVLLRLQLTKMNLLNIVNSKHEAYLFEIKL